MSLKWAGVPDRCPHGEYADKDCVHCHVTKLQAENERMREALDSIAVGCCEKNHPPELCNCAAELARLTREEFLA